MVNQQLILLAIQLIDLQVQELQISDSTIKIKIHIYFAYFKDNAPPSNINHVSSFPLMKLTKDLDWNTKSLLTLKES